MEGKIVRATFPPCINQLKHNCMKIPEEARKEIYNHFHSLKSIQAECEFLINYIKIDKTKRNVPGDSRRSAMKQYCLTFQNEQHTVCRMFFLNTLRISQDL